MSSVHDLIAYHHWAGDRVFSALVAVSAPQLDRKWGGSFGTGRGLLRHMLGAERLWLERWRGNSPLKMPRFRGDETAGGDRFLAEWELVRDEQQAFVATADVAALDHSLTYRNLKGEEWSYPLGVALTHLANHGTYHRGQAVQLLRDLDLPAPATDYLIFVEERR